MKKKIVLTIPALKKGGAEKVFADLALSFDKKIFDILVIVFDGSESFFLKKIKKKVKVIDLNKKKVSFGIIKFVKIVNNFNPEYIFSTLGNLNIAICLVRFFFKKNVKIIVRETNFLSKNINQNKFPIIWKILYKIFLKKSDNIIALSKSIKTDLIKNFKIQTKKIKVIYNPVNFKNISKLSKLKCKLDLTIDKKCTIFLACGSLSYKKGFDILIDALKFVNSNNYKLLILGSGPEEKNLKKQVKDLNLIGKVKFLKFLKNPYPVMQASDVIIISSRHEGCSNVMLEGLFLKKPIISVPCNGANVEILQNKKNCFISKNCSSLSLSKIINDFLSKKKKKNETFLEKKFETSNIIKQYQNLILNT
tara:strand:- start:423 stop:1514 length:1092 start_codon:yes stop_codon:yes gene_type:complete